MSARPDCTCPVEAEGTQYEVRILDRACPRHGDDRPVHPDAPTRPAPVRTEVPPVGARGDERRQARVRELLAKFADCGLSRTHMAWSLLDGRTGGCTDAETGAWVRAFREVLAELAAADEAHRRDLVAARSDLQVVTP